MIYLNLIVTNTNKRLDMNKIKTKDEFHSILSNDKIVVVAFTVTWCPDCHFITPFMDGVAGDFFENIETYEVDADELPELKEEYEVFGIPSFVAFKDGKVLDSFISKKRKSEEEIRAFYSKLK